jgi:hypothetical protein
MLYRRWDLLNRPRPSGSVPPPLEEVQTFVRAVINHHYVQGKDAEPAFTATEDDDWDEQEFIVEFYSWEREPKDTDRFLLLWPFDAKAAEAEENAVCTAYYQEAVFLHPPRSTAPDEWRPWKYKAGDDHSFDDYPTWLEEGGDERELSNEEDDM